MISIILKIACWVWWLWQNPTNYLKRIGSIVWIHLVVSKFPKYFRKIRESVNRSVFTLTSWISFLKNWCNISIYQNIREVPVFYTIVSDNCQSVIFGISVSWISLKGKVSFLGYRWFILFVDVFKNFEFFFHIYFLDLRDLVSFIKYLLRTSDRSM